jgi:hypothetical protein
VRESNTYRAPIGITWYGNTMVWYGMVWYGMAPIWYGIGSLPYHTIPWYYHGITTCLYHYGDTYYYCNMVAMVICNLIDCYLPLLGARGVYIHMRSSYIPWTSGCSV